MASELFLGRGKNYFQNDFFSLLLFDMANICRDVIITESFSSYI